MPVTPVGGLMACLSDVYAVFRPDDLTELFIPVEGWDSTGEAWIVGPTSLVQASAQAGFNRLTSTGQLRGRIDKAKPPDTRRATPVPPGQAS